MTRLASTAKAGFFPTPERVTEWIAHCVAPLTAGGRLLDPCCGEGTAAQCLAQELDVDAYGIEIDAKRALQASKRLKRVLHLDYASARAPHHAFQVLFLNPPYDQTEGEGRRMEYVFLRDTSKWLQARGLLIYIVPQYRVDARMAGLLATEFDSIRAFRFPDPEYANFKQAVIFGQAKKNPRRDYNESLRLLQSCRGELPILPAELPPNERYVIPEPVAEARFYFRGTEIIPQDALVEAMNDGAWDSAEWRGWLEPRKDLAPLQPLMPLKKGHLAMLIAAGMMQNLTLNSAGGSERILVKGRTYKVHDEVDTEADDEEVVRDRFVTEIVALDLTSGAATRIAEPALLAEFVEKWRDALAAKVMQTFKPLYAFDLEAQGNQVLSTLNRLSKHRYLPGRKDTGLFAAQKHVAVAIWKRLQNESSAICVGEPGVGKTTIATAVSELMRQCEGDLRPTLVLCPPHLVAKWCREIQQIVPMAFAMPLYRLSDVTQFVRQVKQLSPGTPAFAVLSREMAKLGSGWRPAFVNQKRHLRVELHNGKTRVDTETEFACPRCAHPVYEIEGEHEIALVQDEGYFTERKRKCFECKEPLFQTAHMSGASPPSETRLIESEFRPMTQRYPIADFIARHHRRLFKLVVADEAHQMKGQSTDQGYALGALVRACDRSLALTGTIYGGRATSIFFLLHRLSSSVRSQFTWNDAQRWAERFGILERVTKQSNGDSGYGTYSGKRRRQTYVREMPGTSPELASILVDCATFVNLTDLGFELPDYSEYPVLLDMTDEQGDAYSQLEQALKGELRQRRYSGDRSLLGAYLQSLLAYPNACFRAETVEDRDGNLVAYAPALRTVGANDTGGHNMFPKETWLVELAKRERARGRRVLVFCRQTATRDITQHLAGVLRASGLHTDILKASIGVQSREEWLRRRVGRSMLDVLIANPRLIETGLDLVSFQTTVWYEAEFSLYTLMQASRRTWRPGQTHNVDVYFAVYRNTMEHRAASLVGQKLAAAQLLYGDSVEGALVDQSDSGRGFLADLARSVIDKSEVPDLSHLFRQLTVGGGNESGANQYLVADSSIATEASDLEMSSQEANDERIPFVFSNAHQAALF